jgi:putative Holliday junction resolvase
MTVVAVDYGRARTGLAACLEGVPVLLEPVVGGGWRGILARLLELRDEYGGITVALGFPLSASGNPTALCDEVEKFAAFLREQDLEVALVRETGSTGEAVSAGARDRRDGRLDSAAAAVILRRFLEIP